jgi:hypothetical protein
MPTLPLPIGRQVPAGRPAGRPVTSRYDSRRVSEFSRLDQGSLRLRETCFESRGILTELRPKGVYCILSINCRTITRGVYQSCLFFPVMEKKFFNVQSCIVMLELKVKLCVDRKALDIQDTAIRFPVSLNLQQSFPDPYCA